MSDCGGTLVDYMERIQRWRSGLESMQGEYLQDCLPLFVVLETVGTLEKTRMGQSGGFSFDLGWRRMLCRPASEHSSYAVEKVVADYQNKSYANVNTFGPKR